MNKFLILVQLLILAGCQTLPTLQPPASVRPSVPGTYHRVAKGETLWKISRMYGMDIDELISYNRLADAAKIEIGQQIFVPYRTEPQAAKIDYSSDEFIWPLKGRVISNFGAAFNGMVNKGINIQPNAANEVVSARAGKVVFCADSLGRFGKTIIIDHLDGISTVYGNNSVILVRAGEKVHKGMAIARSGNYLHFEVRKGATFKNPYYYLP